MQMDKSPADTLSVPLPLAYSVGILLFHMVFNCVTKCPLLYFKSTSFFHSLIQVYITETNINGDPATSDINEEDIKNMPREEHACCFSGSGDHSLMLKREEIELVMAKLGIVCNSDTDDKLKGSEDLSSLFEELEPSFDEIKEAFRAFDQNRDGFIDAEELQRVVYNLGLGEGFTLHAYERMIRTVHKNGDNRIDFSTFVKFMENSLC